MARSVVLTAKCRSFVMNEFLQSGSRKQCEPTLWREIKTGFYGNYSEAVQI